MTRPTRMNRVLYSTPLLRQERRQAREGRRRTAWHAVALVLALSASIAFWAWRIWGTMRP